MDLWDSPIRVMWDPDGVRFVLVPYGAPMWEPVKVDGGQEVQTSQLLRGRGVKNYPRGNESHTIDFTIARVTASVGAAIEAGFFNALGLPRGRKDVLISFRDSGRQIRVRNCAVQKWPHDHDPQAGHVGRESIVILGGEIVADEGIYTEGSIWGEVPVGTLTTEGNGMLGTEGGNFITDEADS